MNAYRAFKNPPSLEQRRAAALMYHCRLATETIHPRFAWVEGGHGILLTVNSGYE